MNLADELGAKQLEMLLEMAPKLKRVALLHNPGNPASARVLKNTSAGAAQRKVTLLPVEARNSAGIEAAFAAMVQQKAGAVIIAGDAAFNTQTGALAALALKHRLPMAAGNKTFAEAGALLSYGSNRTDLFRRAASHVDKIFKGAKPADLPVEQPTRFELVINGKTAKTLGLKIPQALLISAEKVIE